MDLRDLRKGVPSVIPGPSASPSFLLNDLDTSLEQGLRANPNQAARTRQISEQSGVPESAVRDDPETFQRDVRQQEIQGLVSNSPVTSRYLSHPDNAAITHDDVESLVSIEQILDDVTVRTPLASLQAFAEGAVEFPGMAVEGLGSLYEAVGQYLSGLITEGVDTVFGEGSGDLVSPDIVPWYLNPAEILQRPGRHIREGAEALGPDADDRNFVTDVAGGLGQIASQITLMLLTGGLSATAGLAGQGAQIQADRLEERNIQSPEAVILGAGITALTEKAGLDVLLNKLPQNVKSRINRMLLGAGSEASQEIVEGVLQNLTTMGLYDPEQEVFDNALYEGQVAGTVGAIVGLIVPGRQAIAQKEQFEQVSEAANQSAINQRDPDKLAEHVTENLVEQGTTDVYVPGVELAKWLNNQANPREVMYGLGVQNQIEEAIALGQDVRIGPKEFSRWMLQSQDFAGISDHIRTSVDGMTAFEAQELAETDLQERINNLLNTGLMDQTDADLGIAEDSAALQGMFATANEAGMTPKQYEKYLLELARNQEQRRNNYIKGVLRDQQRETDSRIATARDNVRNQIRADLERQPNYQALQGIGRERLDRAATTRLLSSLGLDLNALPRQARNRAIVTPKGQPGIDPESYAELYGFEDATTMLAVLSRTQDLNTAVEQRVDARVRRENPELFSRKAELLNIQKTLYTDRQARILEMELNALQNDKKRPSRVSVKQLRNAARQRMQGMKVKDVSFSKLSNASARAGRRAGMELRRGNRQAAFTHKFQQLLNFHMAALAGKQEATIGRQRAYLRKASRPNREDLPVKYQKAIEDLVSNVNLNQTIRRKRSENISNVANQVVDPPLVNDYLQDEDIAVHYRDFTVEQFTELFQSVKDIEKRGRNENKMRLAEEKNTRDFIAARVVEGVEKNLAPKSQTSQLREERTTWAKYSNYAKSARTLLYNTDTILREIDGFQDLGWAYNSMKRPYDEAMTSGYGKGKKGYLPRQKEVANKITELYSVYSKAERLAFNNKVAIPGVNQRIQKHTALAVLLNTGNDGNYRALVDSGVFSVDEIQAIQQWASKKDWDFVQSVWDYLGTFFDEIVQTEQKRRNYTPKAVQATPIDTPHGTYAGGYYPIKYNRREGFFNSEEDITQMMDQMRYGYFATSQTQRGHTLERQKNQGQPLMLDLHVINGHLDQVIYDLEVGDAVTDIFKILHHPTVKPAFTSAGAIHKWDGIDLWLRDVVTGEIGLHNVVEKMFRHLRTGFTISKLGWNIGVIALQPLGLIQTSVFLGKRNIWYGMRTAHTMGFFGKNSVFNFIEEQSKFMQERGSTWNKDIHDAQRQLSQHWLDRITPGNSAEFIRDSLFVGIKKTQRWVDAVTWLAAKKQAVDEQGMSQEDANFFADRAVARSQASGIFGDRTPLERGSIDKRIRQTELIRAFTPLISYFMAKQNVAVERFKRTRFRNPIESIAFLSDMMLLFTIEALLAGLIRMQWPSEDDDETFAEYAAKETINSLAGGLPIVREAVSSLFGFTGGSVYAKFLETGANAASQIKQGELDTALFKATNNTLGILFKYPSSQINKVVEAEVRRQQGEDVLFMEYIMGPKFER